MIVRFLKSKAGRSEYESLHWQLKSEVRKVRSLHSLHLPWLSHLSQPLGQGAQWVAFGYVLGTSHSSTHSSP